MKRILFVIIVGVIALLSCSSSPDAPLTGNDGVDIVTNKWLNKETQGHFICFESNGNGWEGDVITNNDPQHEINLITQLNITYSLDTLRKTIKAVHEKDNSSKTYQFQLKYENKKRILELDGVSYINGDDIYDAMNLGNVGTVVGLFWNLYKNLCNR